MAENEKQSEAKKQPRASKKQNRAPAAVQTQAKSRKPRSASAAQNQEPAFGGKSRTPKEPRAAAAEKSAAGKAASAAAKNPSAEGERALRRRPRAAKSELLLAQENTERQRQKQPKQQKGQRAQAPVRKTPVRIIPLGGLGEIGKNMTVIECANDMFIIDCGLAFPDDDMLGVDIVIPDFSYVERNLDRLRGVVLTHGHEDHIGALPYFLSQFKTPIYGTRLTLGLVEGKLKEHNLLGKVQLNVVKPRQMVKMGCMSVEFIHEIGRAHV